MGPVELTIVALAGLSIALVAGSLWGNPVLRRISFRNINRKKGSALLVVVGSMVGTALIAGSLVIGDTSERLSRDMAYRHLGEVDEVVTLATSEAGRPAYFDRTAAREVVSVERTNERTRKAKGADLVDGLMTVIVEEAPVQKIDPHHSQAGPHGAARGRGCDGLAGGWVALASGPPRFLASHPVRYWPRNVLRGSWSSPGETPSSSSPATRYIPSPSERSCPRTGWPVMETPLTPPGPSSWASREVTSIGV